MRGYQPPSPTGSTPNAHFDKWLDDAIKRRLQFHDSSTVSWDIRTNGLTAHAAPAAPQAPPAKGASPITPFLYVKQFQNYVIGQNQLTGAMTQIAKDPSHRNNVTTETESDGVWAISYPQNVTGNALAYISRTKTSPDGNYSEPQRYDPTWQVGKVFYAAQISPNAGVSSEVGDTLTPTGTPIVWLDLNGAGRAWAATPDGKA